VELLNRSSNRIKENVVTATTATYTTPTTTTSSTPDSASTVAPAPAEHEGWQALAAASLGRLLSDAELAAAERLPVDIGLDLLFPDLSDAARHEALSTLG
jgi:hypothetical protein